VRLARIAASSHRGTWRTHRIRVDATLGGGRRPRVDDSRLGAAPGAGIVAEADRTAIIRQLDQKTSDLSRDRHVRPCADGGDAMLASLLPGLREVRTPLAVGYLWLLWVWLAFENSIPKENPRDDSLLARGFDVFGMLGPAATVGALSFTAYVLGSAITFPIEGSLATYLLIRQAPRVYMPDSASSKYPRTRLQRIVSSTDELSARYEFERKINRLADAIADMPEETLRAVGLWPRESLRRDPTLADLRIRLLTANQEMYSEYDRFTSEGSFRLNITPPLIATAILFATTGETLPTTIVLLAAVVMSVQGVNRLRSARMVLWRAVITDKIPLPLQAQVKEAQEMHAASLATSDGPTQNFSSRRERQASISDEALLGEDDSV
jgi:hypothetical protein